MFVSSLALALAAVSSPPSSSPPVPASAPPPPAEAEGPAARRAEATNIGFFTAQALADKCRDSSPAGISYCYAYITAVHDTMKAYEVWLNQREFCMAGDHAQGDLRRAFLTYLGAYPENGTGQAASVVAVSLRQTYVCPVEPGNGGGTAPPAAEARAPAPTR